ncbi:MAG: sigma-54-dependent Fis family transcriptional regulator [Nitrospirae bacterium]|nr:sigma-54-dependent Fis family transcriptional regulator [Nitrospirota bacterium]
MEILVMDANGALLAPHLDRLPAPTPLCGSILGTSKGHVHCLAALKGGYVRALEGSIEPAGADSDGFEGSCRAGLRHFVLPVRQGEKTLGFILADGIRRDRGSEADGHGLTTLELELELPAGSLTGQAAEGRALSPEDVGRLRGLVSMVIGEAIAHLGELQERERRIAVLSDQRNRDSGDPRLVGRSSAVEQVARLAERLATSDVPVLIVGERGTGKRLVARILHHGGPRSGRAFLVQSCASLGEAVLDAEVFGRATGTAGGAATHSPGALEAAEAGTLYLDELGDIPPSLQAKLLQFIEDGTFHPAGGTDRRQANVRVVAATRRDPAELVKEGRINPELHEALNAVAVALPPLRERIEDLPQLAEHFLARLAGTGRPKALHPETLRLMMNYTWPGNVRELEHEIERLVILSGAEPILIPDLLSPKVTQPRSSLDADAKGWGMLHTAIRQLARQPWHTAKERWIGLFGRPYLEEVLKSVGENVSQAAKLSGLPRSTFYRLLHKHGLMRRPH